MSDSTFGREVRERRKALDLTQAGLAKDVGLSSHTIRRIETDPSYRTSRDTAERLAKALEVPEDEHADFVNRARSVAPSPTPTPNKHGVETTDASPLIGRWIIKGNNYVGGLEVEGLQESKVIGTVYGVRLTLASWDPTSQEIDFHRKINADYYQIFRGKMKDGDTIEGHYRPISNGREEPLDSWRAERSAILPLPIGDWVIDGSKRAPEVLRILTFHTIDGSFVATMKGVKFSGQWHKDKQQIDFEYPLPSNRYNSPYGTTYKIYTGTLTEENTLSGTFYVVKDGIADMDNTKTWSARQNNEKTSV